MARSDISKIRILSKYIYNNKCLKIGLMGGSFNPPHNGHLKIAKLALKNLSLDEVWWLVSPKNPLKPQNPGNAGNREKSMKFDYYTLFPFVGKVDYNPPVLGT